MSEERNSPQHVESVAEPEAEIRDTDTTASTGVVENDPTAANDDTPQTVDKSNDDGTEKNPDDATDKTEAVENTELKPNETTDESAPGGESQVTEAPLPEAAGSSVEPVTEDIAEPVQETAGEPPSEETGETVPEATGEPVPEATGETVPKTMEETASAESVPETTGELVPETTGEPVTEEPIEKVQETTDAPDQKKKEVPDGAVPEATSSPTAKPTGSPVPVGSKPATPHGSKPNTPLPADSKPNTPVPVEGTQPGSKQPSPTGSRAGSAKGSRTGGTPVPPGSQPGSKPPTPIPTKAEAQAPGTPKGSKHGSPPGTKAPTPKGSKPPTPAPDVPPTPPPLSESLLAAERDSPEEELPSPNALNMAWTFGLNKNVPLLNLSDEKRNAVIYACAHTGVIYDYKRNKQTLLQGHGNALSCTCVSEDKHWLATADKGPDSLIIVWDTYNGVPVRTIFDAHPDGGVVAMAMTPDAKYLATLSAAETQQVLAIWDWTVEGEVPLCTAELNTSFGLQSYIHFNPNDQSQIVTNSESQVIFYSWQTDQLEFYAPPLKDEDFNKQVGRYSQSIFLKDSTRSLTATSCGNLVVWATNKTPVMGKSVKPIPDKKALKLVKLQDRGMNVLTTAGEFIVTGDVLGHIKFFDQTLKLMNWYQDFHLGPVSSISFAYIPEFNEEADPDSHFPPDATIIARKFPVRDFVVGTTTAVYAHVKTDGTNVEVIHRDHDSAVHALASHPKCPHLVVGSYSGLLKIWNYEKKDTVITRSFKHGQMIRCCAFDPQGQYLAVGFMNGKVHVLDALSLEDVISEPFHYARDAITHLAFSHNSMYLATADAEYTVSVFRADPTIRELDGQEPWLYLGRYRAHYKLIQDILWGVQLDSDIPRLMTLGQDRVLVEFDLVNSTTDNLRVLSMDRIEQSATPLCMAWYPPVTKENFIVTANDQYKFKLYNSTTKMCRKTLLGPTYGSPLLKIAILPTLDPIQDKRYLAYITEDKIGLHILPLDGNPHNAAALIAHPQGIANLAASFDGKYLFTAGGVDATVHMWAVNTIALEAQAKLGGNDLVPFYGLLDGGRDGELFKELEDYFYYGQIRSQGVDTTDTRQVSQKIPLSQIPFIMRSMGFYPSEQEIDDMLNEIKYSNYVETGQYTTDIELGEFIKLYINHRPAFGLQADRLQWAFEVLGFKSQDGPAIDRGDLLDILQTKGEHMTEYELAEYLTTLLGYNEEGGSSELQEFDPTTTGDIIEEALPQEITVDMFSNELLGFSMYSDMYDKVDDITASNVETRKSTVAFS